MSAIPIGRPLKGRSERREQARRRSEAWGNIANSAALFICIAGTVYLVSSMVGQVMVEKARREGIRAASRSIEAKKAESMIRRHVEALTSLSAVDEWASAHGFLAPDKQVQPGQAQPKAEVTTPAVKKNEQPKKH